MSAGVASAAAAAPTAFRVLTDAALGVIWKQLPRDRQARHSLRIASRAVAMSPSVNALIKHLELDLGGLAGQDGAPMSPLQQLLRFPKTATLRELDLAGEGGHVKSFVAEAQASAPAQALLGGLTAMRIKEDNVEEEVLRALASLCPSLQQLLLGAVSDPSTLQPLQQLTSLHCLEIRHTAVDLSGGAQAALDHLLRFPRLAMLRKLILRGVHGGAIPFLRAAQASQPAQAVFQGLTSLVLEGCPSDEWRDACGHLADLCPSLHRLEVDHRRSPCSAEPLQQLRNLRSLDLYMHGRDLGIAVPSLGSLTGLTQLMLCLVPRDNEYTPAHAYPVDVSALGQLQNLAELTLQTVLGVAVGLPAVATGCTQLTRLVLHLWGVQAEAAGQAGAGAAPWWPSLEEVEYLYAGEPGHLAALHLDRAKNLQSAQADRQANMFSQLVLDGNSPASSPEAIGELGRQLAALPARLHPCSLKLVERSEGPLTQHLAAIALIWPNLKGLELVLDAYRPAASLSTAAAALCAALPCLEDVQLDATQLVLPAAALLQLVMGLPQLHRLTLRMRPASISDVVLAAQAVEQQVGAGRRKQDLVIKLGESHGLEVVHGGAAAVNQLLAKRGWQLRHVKVEDA